MPSRLRATAVDTRFGRSRVAAVCAGMLIAMMPVTAVHASGHAPDVKELRDELAAATASLQEIAAAANAALEKAQDASLADAGAQQRLDVARAKLAAARDVVAARKNVIAEYAAAAYRSGGSPNLRQAFILLGSNSINVLRQADSLNLVGEKQREVLQQAAIERRQEQLAAESADVAAKGAGKAAEAAEAARQAADVLVGRQQAAVEGATERLTAQEAAVLRAQQAARAARLAEAQRLARVAEEKRLAQAELLARTTRERERAQSARRASQRAAAAAARASRDAATAKAEQDASTAQVGRDDNVPSGVVEGCTGRSLRGFRNGRIPASALCPLWGAGNHRLRSDAAAGFSALSQAYAGEFGRPMCITDSYRSYAEQVDVKRRKPGLAAPAGTSQHGWGLAVDLCGGVQSDGTAANNWLRNNAGRFRFFHPSWANAGGSGPYEPWHWEFSG